MHQAHWVVSRALWVVEVDAITLHHREVQRLRPTDDAWLALANQVGPVKVQQWWLSWLMVNLGLMVNKPGDKFMVDGPRVNGCHDYLGVSQAIEDRPQIIQQN